ncbi:MAG: SLOG family protein [Dehalococcoidales bacterium]
MMNTLLIVAGGRDFDDVGMFNEALYRFPSILTTEFVNGMCETGADRLAREYARKRGRKVHEFPADWDKFGPKAGPLRNGKMATYVSERRWAGIKGVLIAFWDGASNGTRSMINEALRHGLEVHVYRYSK